jgi:hypothetical protein
VTALLLVDAVDTAGVLLDAILAWIVAIAFVATVVVYTTVLTGAWAGRKAWRAVRRGVAGCWRAEHATPSPVATETVTEPHAPTQPTWAHTETEAA